MMIVMATHNGFIIICDYVMLSLSEYHFKDATCFCLIDGDFHIYVILSIMLLHAYELSYV